MAPTKAPHPVETLVAINSCHFCGERATHDELFDGFGHKLKTCCKCFSTLVSGKAHLGGCASIVLVEQVYGMTSDRAAV